MTLLKFQMVALGLLTMLFLAQGGAAQSASDLALEPSQIEADVPVESDVASSLQLSYLRQDAYTIMPNRSLAIRYACPPGQRILGGGWSVSDDCPLGCALGARISSNGPPRDATNTWETIVTNLGTRTLIGNFYRLCASQ